MRSLHHNLRFLAWIFVGTHWRMIFASRCICLLLLFFVVSCTLGKNVTMKYGRHELTFIKRPVNFYQATDLCEKLGLNLALPSDMELAYQKGFHNCKLGWLATMRTVYSQYSTGKDKCFTKSTGILYSRKPHSTDVAAGAYCTSRKHFRPGPYNPNNKKIYNLWMRYDLWAVFNLREDLRRNFNKKIIKNIRTLYPCCNIFQVKVVKNKNGDKVTTVTMQKTKEDTHEYQYLLKKYFPESRPKVIPHLHISQEAMVEYKAGTSNRTATIKALVSKVLENGWDGIMVDYEPATMFGKEHAQLTADFLDELSEELHVHKKEVGFCISGWGILKFWSLYNATKVDNFATMSMTYFGDHVRQNVKNVKALLKEMDHSRIQIGIKSKMYEPPDPVTKKVTRSAYAKPSLWKYRGLHYFVKWIQKKTPIEQVHIWPESFGKRSRTTVYFYELLSALSN